MSKQSVSKWPIHMWISTRTESNYKKWEYQSQVKFTCKICRNQSEVKFNYKCLNNQFLTDLYTCEYQLGLKVTLKSENINH